MSTEILIMVAAEIGDGSTYRLTRKREGAAQLATGCIPPAPTDIYSIEPRGFVGRAKSLPANAVLQFVGGIPMDVMAEHFSPGVIVDILSAQCARIKLGSGVEHIPAAMITTEWGARPVEA